MAFVKRTWKDRISEFPNRRTVNDGYVTKQVTVGRDEGNITEAGDSFDASNMNDLEQRIEDAYGDVQALVGSEVAAQYNQDNVIFDPVATVGHGTGFVVSSDYIANLEVGDLADTDISGQALGEALVWDGAKWVNGTVSTVGNLDDLSDVDTSGKASGDSLRYDGNEWVAKPTTIEMTQAEYNAIVDFTPYANTHIVITDAPNLNPTASDIEYQSGVTVANAISSENTPNEASYLYKPTVTEPTLTNGTNHNHRTYYYKHGSRVCLSLGVSGLNTGLTGQILFALPSGYKPRLSLSLVTCGYSFDKTSAVQILDNGTVIVQYTTDQGCFGYIEFDAYS